MKKSAIQLSQNIRIRTQSKSESKNKQTVKNQQNFPKIGKQNGVDFNQKQQISQKKIQKNEKIMLKQKIQSNFRLSNSNKRKLSLLNEKNDINPIDYIHQIKDKFQKKQVLRIRLSVCKQVIESSLQNKSDLDNNDCQQVNNLSQIIQVKDNFSNDDNVLQNFNRLRNNKQKTIYLRNTDHRATSYCPVNNNESLQPSQGTPTKFNEQQYKNDCKKMMGALRGNWFQIVNQFSINLLRSGKMVDSQTQTTTSNTQDKFFLQYIKFKTLKTKNFNEIEQKNQKLKAVIEDGQKFNKNYAQLIEYIEKLPTNDRQQRVFALSNNLQQQEVKFTKVIEKFIEFTKRGQDYHSGKLKLFQQKVSSVRLSIDHLLKICLKQFERVSPNDKYTRILTRVMKQFKYCSKMSADINDDSLALFSDLKPRILELNRDYIQWTGLLLQNRVLLYNFFKQMETIPAMTISLFGSQQNQLFSGFNKPENLKQKMDKYMSLKCEQCYDLKQKVKYIQFKNCQIKPIIKSLEWLLRDGNKKKNLLSVI